MTLPHTLPARVAALAAAFEGVDAEMRSLPVYNSRLTVEAVGFRLHDGYWIGVVITPWFMAVMALPTEAGDWHDLELGDSQHWTFPSGDYEFRSGVVGDGLRYQSLSLFSPMSRFETQDDAREAAGGALTALFGPPGEDAERSTALPSEIARRNQHRQDRK